MPPESPPRFDEHQQPASHAVLWLVWGSFLYGNTQSATNVVLSQVRFVSVTDHAAQSASLEEEPHDGTTGLPGLHWKQPPNKLSPTVMTGMALSGR